jgi:hypothetical protein
MATRGFHYRIYRNQKEIKFLKPEFRIGTKVRVVLADIKGVVIDITRSAGNPSNSYLVKYQFRKGGKFHEDWYREESLVKL